MTTPTTSTSDVPGLINLLERQCELYQKLAALGRQQSALIGAADDADEASGGAELLLRVLAQRQKIINDVTAVQQSLAPYRSRWVALWEELSDEQRRRIGPLVAQVEATLTAILAQDDKDRRQLQQTHRRVGTQIHHLTTASGAMAAYRASPAAVAARYTNQQG